MNDCIYLSDEFEAVCMNLSCEARSNICPCLNFQHICKYYKSHIQTNLYDEREVHENCTVEILKNSITGETSVGWYENERS